MRCAAVIGMALAGLAGDALAFSPAMSVVARSSRAPRALQAVRMADDALLPKPERSVELKPIFVDEAKVLQEQDFALPPETLIAAAKTFLESRGGFGADPALLADNFEFIGPVVGPLGKEEFLSAIGSVDMKTAFPDFQGEFYAFSVDPFEGNRVWYIARGRGTNTGPLPPFAPQATNRTLVNPPQACSLTFDQNGLVTKYTIGYVMDRDVGTTGGLGGLYGVLYAIGKPLPFREARPWKMSKRYRVFNYVGGVLQKLVAKNRQQNVDTVDASEDETDVEEGKNKSEAPLKEEKEEVVTASAEEPPKSGTVTVTLKSGKTIEVPSSASARTTLQQK